MPPSWEYNLIPNRRVIVNDLEHPAQVPAVENTPTLEATNTPVEPISHPVDPVRSAAGRLGGKRVHHLAELGRQYEQEHGLKAGRQRLKQLVQLGKRYEVEHGLKVARPRRQKGGDAWQEFLAALARVVKPAHRPAVEQLVAALQAKPESVSRAA
jgi:hypothetical protein